MIDNFVLKLLHTLGESGFLLTNEILESHHLFANSRIDILKGSNMLVSSGSDTTLIGVCFTYQKEDKTWATKAQPTACEEADEFRLRKQIHTEAQ